MQISSAHSILAPAGSALHVSVHAIVSCPLVPPSSHTTSQSGTYLCTHHPHHRRGTYAGPMDAAARGVRAHVFHPCLRIWPCLPPSRPRPVVVPPWRLHGPYLALRIGAPPANKAALYLVRGPYPGAARPGPRSTPAISIQASLDCPETLHACGVQALPAAGVARATARKQLMLPSAADCWPSSAPSLCGLMCRDNCRDGC